jgi:plastocyanin
MRFAGVLAALTALMANFGATAAELSVRVADGAGHPVSDAVATIIPDPTAKIAVPAPAPPETRIIDQKNITFVPYVQIVRPGDPVVFRNSDDTRHHVYSFARIKSFEFVLSPGEVSPPITVAGTGVAAVGCNIHDNMIAYLFVSDAPWIGQSGADGVIRFGDLPAAGYTVHLWHPQLHPAFPELTQQVSLDNSKAEQSVAFSLSLLPDPRQRMTHERMRY